jgi:hypothetical protein
MQDNVIHLKSARRPSFRDDSGGPDSLHDRIAGAKRLSPADKPLFAENMGKLAAELSPGDPLEGVKRIIDGSGLAGIWEKRKRYFRFPGEVASDPGSEGAYASSPLKFLTLADAASILLCASSDPGLQKRTRQRVIKCLATGTSFLPKVTPSSDADLSAKDLLDEYASALANAVKSRTRITKLWEILDTIPFSSNLITEEEAEDFEPDVLTPIEGAGIFSYIYDNPNPSFPGNAVKYACSKILIGYASLCRRVRLFHVPESNRDLFADANSRDGISEAATNWLKSVGFELDSGAFPTVIQNQHSSIWDRSEIAGWRTAFVSISFPVYIGIYAEYVSEARPREPRVCLSFDYSEKGNMLFHNYGEFSWSMTDPSNLSISLITNENRFRKVVDLSHGFDVELIYDEANHYPERSAPPVSAIVPLGTFSRDMYDDMYETASLWPHEIYECNLWSIEELHGWTENEDIFRIMTNGESTFSRSRLFPLIPDSEPSIGVFAEGSIAASLIHNAQHAPPENKITEKLINEVAQLAESGLGYYETLLAEARSAIRRI